MHDGACPIAAGRGLKMMNCVWCMWCMMHMSSSWQPLWSPNQSCALFKRLAFCLSVFGGLSRLNVRRFPFWSCTVSTYHSIHRGWNYNDFKTYHSIHITSLVNTTLAPWLSSLAWPNTLHIRAVNIPVLCPPSISSHFSLRDMMRKHQYKHQYKGATHWYRAFSILGKHIFM